MQKVTGKNGKKETVFLKLELPSTATSCSVCGRPFKEKDSWFINVNQKIVCPKCGTRITFKF